MSLIGKTIRVKSLGDVDCIVIDKVAQGRHNGKYHESQHDMYLVYYNKDRNETKAPYDVALVEADDITLIVRGL